MIGNSTSFNSQTDISSSMTEEYFTADIHDQKGSRSVIVRRLVLLRLALVVATTAGLSYLWWGLHQSVDFTYILLALGIVAVHSAFAFVRIYRAASLTEIDLWSFLVVDAVALLLVVSETGRTANPFIYYLLVMIAVSATVLSLRACALFTFGCCVAYTTLLWFDIQSDFGHHDSDFQLHLLGMWINFVGSAVLISVALARLSRALRHREAALASIREASLQNEQLVGLGALAASTVHALGTPLSTLSVLLGDMQDTLADPEAKQDVALMLDQIDRCRSTMQKLSLLAENESANPQAVEVSELAEELKQHYLLSAPAVVPRFFISYGCAPCRIYSDMLMTHALINLIDNAIQAAENAVDIRFQCNKDPIKIEIENDGESVPSEVLDRWGKPVASTKRGGLGIGVFLANNAVERLGGKIHIRQSGFGMQRNCRTIIEIILPLATNGSHTCP